MAEGKNSQPTNNQRDKKNDIMLNVIQMAIRMDLVEDPIKGVKKWRNAFEDNSDQMINDFLNIADGIETGRTENAQKVADYARESYKNNNFQYKEAMQLLESLQNKELSQVITCYFFFFFNMEPFSKEPLSEANKEELITLAGLIDDIVNVVTRDLSNRSGKKCPPENISASELFILYANIFYNAYLSKSNQKDQQNTKETKNTIFLKAEFTETITGSATTEPVRQLELPFMPPIMPKYYVMPNNALINDLENRNKLRINFGPYDLSVFGENSEITSYITISYEQDPDSGITIKGPDRLTAYERTVSNAIVSLWEAALKEGQTKPIISPEMIYRTMPGGGEKLPPGQKGAIVKAINKFRILHIEIDATEEMQKRKVIGPKETYTLDSNYLLFTHAQYKAQNGRTVHAYRIEAEPIILTYSKAAKRLLSIPAKYLDIRQVIAGKITDKPIRMSEDRQAITDYLLRRIAIMKYDAKKKTQEQSRNILFDAVYRIAGQEDKPRDQKKELRNFCFDVLEYQAAAGNIAGYKKIKDGREIAKIEILL